VNWLVAHYAQVLAGVFAVAAVAHLAGRKAYRNYPRGFREVTGALLAVAAALLAVPLTRPFGLIVAVLVMFLSATTLLHRRQYGFASAVIALLFALIPISLTV
jgi:hypothetical protein